LTKIEVQAQEKSDSIKSDLQDVSQRVRQLDWQSSRMEAALEAIKIDTNGLKHGQDHIRGIHAQSGKWLIWQTFTYGLLMVVSNSHDTMLNGNEELQRMWKKNDVTWVQHTFPATVWMDQQKVTLVKTASFQLISEPGPN